MTTASEEILSRYKKAATVVDKFGRTITIRRLRPSEQLDIRDYASSDNETVITMMTAAASVSTIDDLIYAFPRNKAEVKLVLDKLDVEGFAAVGEAFKELNGADEKPDADLPQT